MTTPGRKPPKTTRTEAEVMAQVLEAAQMLGIELARQNTGMALNPRGQAVRFGTAGNSDLIGQIGSGPNKGSVLHVEVKREGFDPARARGEERERFGRQLARLERTNEQGGIGFWVDDAAEFLTIMRHVLAGARVEEPGHGRPIIFYPEIKELSG